MMSKLSIIPLLSLLWASMAVAQADRRPYPQTCALDTGSAEPGALVAAPLPPTVFPHLDPAMRNLLLVDAAGYAVAYQLRPLVETRTETYHAHVPSAQKTLSVGDGNELSLRVDRTSDDVGSIDGLEIHTSLRDFQQSVSVYSRPNDNADWQSLAIDAPIFDYSQYLDLRDTRVSFPPTHHPQFRIVFKQAIYEIPSNHYHQRDRNAQAKDGSFQEVEQSVIRRPFRIDAVRLTRSAFRSHPKSTVLRDYPPTRMVTETDPDSGDSIITLDMQREPISAIRLETDARNVSRTLRVEESYQSETGKRWRSITESRIFRIGMAPHEKSSLTVSFPERRPKQLRLTIVNHNMPPLAFTAVTPRGPSWQLRLILPEALPITAYLGGASPAPPYDPQPIEQLALTATATPASLANPADNPIRDTHKLLGFIEGSLIFYVVILIMIAALAYALFRAAKQTPADAPRPE